jgi:hypothetical protein
MRRFVAVAMAGLLLLAFAAPTTAGTTLVKVFADQGWTNSGIWVEAGQTYSIQVAGRVDTDGPGKTQPGGPDGSTDAGFTCGEAYDGNSEYWQRVTGPCLVDGAYFAELVVGIRGEASRTDWALGDATEIDAVASGWLFFAVNDFQDTYFDNSGSFTITFP